MNRNQLIVVVLGTLLLPSCQGHYQLTGVERTRIVVESRYDQNPGDIKVIAVCLDADVKECRRHVNRDSVKWSTICDGRMWDTPLLRQTGLSYLPDNIITDAQGKIIAHTLNNNDLNTKIEEILKKTP